MKLDYNQQAFFALVRAGLWERDVQLSHYGVVDFSEVYRLAEEQSIVGLVAAGIEHVSDIKVPQEVALTFVGSALQLEQRNLAMNNFVAMLIDQLRKEDVYTLLVKGQGIAQCYERPLWRACGDVDLLLNGSDYRRAVQYLTTLASKIDKEEIYKKHCSMLIDGWEVECHGTLRGGKWSRLDYVIDSVQHEVFYNGSVRSWINGDCHVFLPHQDCDVFFVFAHILQHFFKEGIGLRQICDWCRLLWTYRDTINQKILESRLKQAGAMTEWKTFSALAVDMLGFPSEAMPFYSPDKKWVNKANKVLSFIVETGNFGHNRNQNYHNKYPYFIVKTISFWRHLKDGMRYFLIFPWDSIKVSWSMTIMGLKEIFHLRTLD